MSPTPTPRRTDTDTQPGYVSDTVRSGDDPVTVRLAAVIETLDALEDAADHTRDAIAAAVRSHGNRRSRSRGRSSLIQPAVAIRAGYGPTTRSPAGA